MDVVQSNFEEAVALLTEFLPRAEFVAIDCEMTGIRGKPELWLDSPQHRYSKMKFVSTRYKLIQVGIALFIREGEGHWAFPMNFYVFPRDPAEKVILEVGAVAFNRKNEMDFNKWIYEGIHYVDENGENLLRNKIYGVETNSEIVLHRPRDIELFQEITARVQNWYVSDSRELELESLNAFHRKYFYQKILKEFPDITTETIGDSKSATLKLSKESDVLVDREIRRAQKMQDGLGFRRVFKLLTEAKRPLLGHNLLIDLMFMYASFKGNLPYHLEEFEAIVHADFPVVYDTRYMYMNIPGFKTQYEEERLGSSLTELHDYLKQKSNLDVTLGPRCEKYLEKKAHEAGYDAYVTGELFLMLRGPDAERYCNLLVLYKSLFAINLGGGVVLPEGEILVVKGQNIEAHLERFEFKKISETSALLILDSEQATALKRLRSSQLEVLELAEALINDDNSEPLQSK